MLDLDPPPPPYSLGFCLASWCAAEADYPPTTCGGSPPRLLMIGWELLMVRGRGRADESFQANGPSRGLSRRERQEGTIDG
jgi:hypothetical protein